MFCFFANSGVQRFFFAILVKKYFIFWAKKKSLTLKKNKISLAKYFIFWRKKNKISLAKYFGEILYFLAKRVFDNLKKYFIFLACILGFVSK
jgi:hypothetical protein